MSKNLILFLLISFCSFSGGINEKSIEESLNDLCDRISHCRSDEEAKKSSILRILGNSLYEFNYQDKNGNYKFYIPEDTEIVKGKNKNTTEVYNKNGNTWVPDNEGSGKSSGTTTELYKRTNLSMPIGFSYEYNKFSLDLRYNIGLTKVYNYIEENICNRNWVLTIGYGIVL